MLWQVDLSCLCPLGLWREVVIYLYNDESNANKLDLELDSWSRPDSGIARTTPVQYTNQHLALWTSTGAMLHIALWFYY